MKLGIRGKLLLVSLCLIGASVVAADLYLSSTLDQLLTERIRDDLLVRARLLAQRVSLLSAPASARRAWDQLADELGTVAQARVTLIPQEGRVLGDSELDEAALAALENHGARPEVAAALLAGRGTSTRLSATLQQRMLYVAAPFSGAARGVVRIAMPLADVDRALARLHWLLAIATLVAMGVATLLSSAAAHLMARNVRLVTAAARRMAEGDLAVRLHPAGQDEVSTLGAALNQLAESLSLTLSELREKHDLLSGMLQGMQEGVLLLDAHGQVLLLNTALRDMLLLPAEAVGQPGHEVIRNAELQEVLDQARDSGSATGEVELGSLKPRRLLVQAAALDAGRLLAVFVDVTHLRRLETLRKDFVANVSHELRTPVTAVRSAAETLRGALYDAQDPQAAARFLDIIERNAARLQRLVEDLLDLSRIEARAFHLQPEPLAAEAVARHCVSLLREPAEKKGIHVEVRVPADLRVRADRRALEQVLVNLLDNAIKYCPERARITLRGAPEGELVALSVEDSGPGIAERHLPRLFERFYRVNAGRSRELGGTGLGLSIVKHLVEAMGGTVHVESQLGAGSTFTCRLPIAADEAWITPSA